MSIGAWIFAIIGGLLALYAFIFVVVCHISNIINYWRMRNLQKRMILDDPFLTDEWRDEILEMLDEDN